MASFTSGIVLLLSIWGGKRSGLTIDPNKEMADVHKCMQMLKISESRWHSAGRLWYVSALFQNVQCITKSRDILYELASVGDLPLPQSSPPSTLKREREDESAALPASGTSATTPTSAPPTDSLRSLAGSKRLNKDVSVCSKPVQPAPQPRSSEPGPSSTNLAPSSSSGSTPASIHPSPQSLEPPPCSPRIQFTCLQRRPWPPPPSR